jgi:hypothetical protein
VNLAGVEVHEQGPLSRCASFMDTASRRVLPGHLLRRARMLSSLTVGGSCLLRVALTACTGEEATLLWRLGLAALPGLSSSSSSQQARAGGDSQQQQQQQQQHDSLQQQQQQAPAPHTCWQVLSVARDATDDEEHLPASPHPRASPELVVRAQLRALRQQELLAACGFNLMGRHASSSGWETHLQAWKRLLQEPAYQALCAHTGAELGASALPSQRQLLQEVVLSGADDGASSSRSSSSSRFLWRLGMQADGCWMVRSIEVL